MTNEIKKPTPKTYWLFQTPSGVRYGQTEENQVTSFRPGLEVETFTSEQDWINRLIELGVEYDTTS